MNMKMKRIASVILFILSVSCIQVFAQKMVGRERSSLNWRQSILKAHLVPA